MEQKGAAGNALGLWDLWFQGFVICHEKSSRSLAPVSQALPIHAQKRRANGDPTALARYIGLRDDDRLFVTKFPQTLDCF